MANSSRITRASAPRVLQLGLDRILDDIGDVYKGPGDDIFTAVPTKKAYLEMMKLSGMGLASVKGEGEPITYDSVDQAWIYTLPIISYEKGARITREMLEDNLYEDFLPRIGREQRKAIDTSRDTIEANIFNNAFTSGVTYGDGSILVVSTHALQSGGTNSNVLAVAAALSEDSLENLKILADGMKNDDGILGDYEVQDLIIPKELQFEAHRILNSMGRKGTPDNDTNALREMGIVRSIKVWKRLTSTTAFFLTTNCEEGLILARREGLFTQSSQDPYTWDTILSAGERYAVGVGKHQAVVATPGA